jgi:hypothetical protein
MAVIVRASSSSATETLCFRCGVRVFRHSRTSEVRRTSSGETLTGSRRALPWMRWLSRSSSVKRISSIGVLTGSWRGKVVVERSVERGREGRTQRRKTQTTRSWPVSRRPRRGRPRDDFDAGHIADGTAPRRRCLRFQNPPSHRGGRRRKSASATAMAASSLVPVGTYEKQNPHRCVATFPNSLIPYGPPRRCYGDLAGCASGWLMI